MSSIEHTTEQVEAYALDALDPAERATVDAHLAVCPQCNKLAQAARDAAQFLAFAARPADPPLRCKRTVMERIERDQFLRAPTPRRAQRRVPWSTWAAVAAVLALMVTGGRMVMLQTELAQAQAQIDNLTNRLNVQAAETAQMRESMAQFASFSSVLADRDSSRVCAMKHDDIKATCFARPGDGQAVMVVAGLEPVPAGKTYQLWLANDREQAALTAFNTRPNGTAEVPFTPKNPFDHYTAIMVTVENAGGAQQPSDEVVLDGSL